MSTQFREDGTVQNLLTNRGAMVFRKKWDKERSEVELPIHSCFIRPKTDLFLESFIEIHKIGKIEAVGKQP